MIDAKNDAKSKIQYSLAALFSLLQLPIATGGGGWCDPPQSYKIGRNYTSRYNVRMTSVVAF